MRISKIFVGPAGWREPLEYPKKRCGHRTARAPFREIGHAISQTCRSWIAECMQHRWPPDDDAADVDMATAPGAVRTGPDQILGDYRIRVLSCSIKTPHGLRTLHRVAGMTPSRQLLCQRRPRGSWMHPRAPQNGSREHSRSPPGGPNETSEKS